MNKIETLLKNFSEFWLHFFPEAGTLDRQQVLTELDDADFGRDSTRPDCQLVSYQNCVATVYGAYEQARFQVAAMGHILRSVRQFPAGGTLVSLGSGPGSYELWLLLNSQLGKVILVDHSSEMLARATSIAKEIGVADRLQTICTDATQNSIPPHTADVIFSINALHWSSGWRAWLREAARVGKPDAEVFISCSLLHPRSNITPDQFGQATREYFNISKFDMVVPPRQMPDGQTAVSSRFFFAGTKKR